MKCLTLLFFILSTIAYAKNNAEETLSIKFIKCMNKNIKTQKHNYQTLYDHLKLVSDFKKLDGYEAISRCKKLRTDNQYLDKVSFREMQTELFQIDRENRFSQSSFQFLNKLIVNETICKFGNIKGDISAAAGLGVGIGVGNCSEGSGRRFLTLMPVASLNLLLGASVTVNQGILKYDNINNTRGIPLEINGGLGVVARGGISDSAGDINGLGVGAGVMIGASKYINIKTVPLKGNYDKLILLLD